MEQRLSDVEVLSVLASAAVAMVAAWIASGSFAKERRWGQYLQWPFRGFAVLLAIPVAFVAGSVLLVMGSWPAVVAGMAGSVLTVPSVRTYLRSAWAELTRPSSRRCARVPKVVDAKKLSATAWTVKRDSVRVDADAPLKSRYVGNAPGSESPFEVSFRYIDADGNVSDRRISAIWFGQYKVDAYCHHRKAERSFRYDRIVGDVLDVDTGELIAVHRWKAMCLDEAES